MTRSNLPLPARIAPLLALSTLAAHASCGSAFCTLMTDRFAQGGGAPHSGWSIDLRLEQVDQDRLRSGTRDLDPGQVTGEEAIERYTHNTNLVAAVGYGFGADWSLLLRAPLVRRDHLHDLVDEETGQPATPERWRFTKPGDAQVLLRRQFLSDDAATSAAVFGGLKLPTGAIDVTNDEGSRAERALQPGSGTTDVVVGLAGRWAAGPNDALFGQVSLAQALNARQDFKPGRRAEAALGWSHAASERFGTVLQLNLRQRGRDAGAQAEPANSGSTTVDLSPGLTFGIGPSSTLYAYLQWPLYQNVNGIQLVPQRAFALGWTRDF